MRVGGRIVRIAPRAWMCCIGCVGMLGVSGAPVAAQAVATVHALACPAAGQAIPLPLTIIDGLGRTVQLSRPPQRIVPIFSSNTELVAHLGLSERIVGVEEYTRFPPEVVDRPKVGGRLGFSVDAIAALQPDLLIVTPARQAAHQLLEPMRRLGVPVVVLLSRSVLEVIDNLRRIAQISGVAAHGEALARALEARVAAVRHRVTARQPPRAVMITGRIGNGMLLVARPDTYTGQAMVIAGARHALQATSLAQVSPEAILASQPDVLLFAGAQADMAALLAQPGWRDLPAVRTGRARTVSRAEFLIPGPRTIDGIETLAAWLHPLRDSDPP